MAVEIEIVKKPIIDGVSELELQKLVGKRFIPWRAGCLVLSPDGASEIDWGVHFQKLEDYYLVTREEFYRVLDQHEELKYLGFLLSHQVLEFVAFHWTFCKDCGDEPSKGFFAT